MVLWGEDETIALANKFCCWGEMVAVEVYDVDALNKAMPMNGLRRNN